MSSTSLPRGTAKPVRPLLTLTALRPATYVFRTEPHSRWLTLELPMRGGGRPSVPPSLILGTAQGPWGSAHCDPMTRSPHSLAHLGSYRSQGGNRLQSRTLGPNPGSPPPAIRPWAHHSSAMQAARGAPRKCASHPHRLVPPLLPLSTRGPWARTGPHQPRRPRAHRTRPFPTLVLRAVCRAGGQRGGCGEETPLPSPPRLPGSPRAAARRTDQTRGGPPSPVLASTEPRPGRKHSRRTAPGPARPALSSLTFGGAAGHEEAGRPAREPLGRHGPGHGLCGLRVRGACQGQGQGPRRPGGWAEPRRAHAPSRLPPRLSLPALVRVGVQVKVRPGQSSDAVRLVAQAGQQRGLSLGAGPQERPPRVFSGQIPQQP